ncbi:MAG: helix-turn-helix domain-containing protein [Phycisphaerales bacterium]|nr:helix-turn-helix domain-containing protein [Phycisphaerales bacterium]MBK8916172.1 helix-turn-helix domain-containing protein [Phycisphaerales bacterium]
MANRLKMAKVHSIQTLHAAGWSQRRIARVLGVDRGTVARYVQARGRLSKTSRTCPPVRRTIKTSQTRPPGRAVHREVKTSRTRPPGQGRPAAARRCEK